MPQAPRYGSGFGINGQVYHFCFRQGKRAAQAGQGDARAHFSRGIDLFPKNVSPTRACGEVIKLLSFYENF